MRQEDWIKTEDRLPEAKYGSGLSSLKRDCKNFEPKKD